MTSSKIPHDEESLAIFKERRRRERWNAFLTPFLTLTSIVVSVGLTMSLVKACQARFPNSSLNRPAEREPAQGLPPEPR
jgi:hypothetical protein